MEYPDLLENVSLAKYSYYQIGGLARYFYVAKNKLSLKEILLWAKQQALPIFVLGSGSNVLFADTGFAGLIIKNECSGIELAGTYLKVESGALLKDVILFARENNLMGMEELWGLPGTIGGAVCGNAGSFGTEIKNLIHELRVWTPLGEKIMRVSELDFSYRSSRCKHAELIILEVTLKLRKVSDMPDLADILEKRKAKQPAGMSCGSFFKNPVGEKSAGQLIEEAGLKGLRVGDAEVSEKHANFILNLGQASFADVIAVKDKVQALVKEKFGIELEPEVVIVK